MDARLAYTSYLKDIELSQKWLNGYWPTVPVSFSGLYLLLIYLLKQWMHTRKPMKLKPQLILWNACLATFSIIAFVQFAPSGLLYELVNGGFVHSVCLVKPFSTPTLNLWSNLFILSKFVEFGDTVFLVLRKSPLTFLHVYHHVTVAVYTWFGGTDHSSIGHWFCAMNYGIHSLMYTYFMLKALGVNLPLFVAKSITSLQLCQFTMGLVCIVLATARLLLGKDCNTSITCATVGLIIYGSYLALFMNFFYDRYIKVKPKKE